jgi:uncharacterized RDD family membrane protein YckC
MSDAVQSPDCCAGCNVTACKENALDDLKAGVSSDGIDMAGIGTRLAAQIIDGLIIGLPVMALAFAFGFYQVKTGAQPGFGTQVVQQVIFSIPFLIYAGLMLNQTGGQTLGKKVMKIRVVSAEGASANYWKREGVRWALSLIPLVGLIDYLFAFNKQRRTLHDKFGGTIVVRMS